MRQARTEDPTETPAEPPVEARAPHPAHRLLADLENEIERLNGRRVGRTTALIAEIRRTLP